MRSCAQTVCLQLHCPCPQPHQPTQPSNNNRVSQFYSKVSQTVQEQLKRQHDLHLIQVDELNNQLFHLKNTVLRLQMRNQKDQQAQKQLRREYDVLADRLKQVEPQVITRVEYVQKIKEVVVEMQDSQLWQKQIEHWRAKNNDLIQQLHKLRTQKEVLEQQKQNAHEQLNRTRRHAEALKDKNQQLAKAGQQKDELIKKLHAQIDYLKHNKEVVIQTKHLFPEFRQPEVVRTQTKIQTIYAQKPIEKLVFVDVVRKVKQFIQPQKAVVNRIISCEDRPQCDCQYNINTLQSYKQQNGYLCGLVQKLQGNIASYKVERQNLVKVIAGRDSQLNRLQTTLKLMAATNPQPQSISRTGSSVNVAVNKTNQQRTKINQKPSRNTSIGQQKQAIAALKK